MAAFSSTDPVELLQASMEYSSQLVDATAGRTVSLLPADLSVTNVILDQIVSIQEGQNATTLGSGLDEVWMCFQGCHLLHFGFIECH